MILPIYWNKENCSIESWSDIETCTSKETFNWIVTRHWNVARNVWILVDKSGRLFLWLRNNQWIITGNEALSYMALELLNVKRMCVVRVKLGGEKYAPQSNFSALISRDSDLNIWLWNVYGIKRLNALGTVKLDCIHNWDITNGRANAGSDDIMQAQILVRRESWGDKNHWRERHTC